VHRCPDIINLPNLTSVPVDNYYRIVFVALLHAPRLTAPGLGALSRDDFRFCNTKFPFLSKIDVYSELLVVNEEYKLEARRITHLGISDIYRRSTPGITDAILLSFPNLKRLRLCSVMIPEQLWPDRFPTPSVTSLELAGA
jgi:hypothetical protein